MDGVELWDFALAEWEEFTGVSSFFFLKPEHSCILVGGKKAAESNVKGRAPRRREPAVAQMLSQTYMDLQA